MSLSDISIKKPVFAWMLMIGIMVFGYLSFRGLGIGNMPDVDFPVISVDVTWEGAAPEVMESDVTDVIEDAIMSIQGIRDVTSTSRQGRSSVIIEFNLERSVDAAFQEVQTKVSQAQLRLPREIDPPILTKVNPTDQPILWLGVSGNISKRDLMTYVQDVLKDKFQTISGVGDIILGGYVERNLRIWVSYAKLDEYQLTVSDVIKAVEKNHVEIPAGRIETDRIEMNVRSMGEALNPAQFGDIAITDRNGKPIYKPIYIKEIATIEDGLADIRKISRVQGQTAVGLGIRKQRGANAVAVGRRVKERLKEVQKELPGDIELEINFDATKFSEESINELLFTLILSCLLTAAVCWIFLGSIGSTFNILLAMPTSVLGTFLAFRFCGFTLNTFTLLGLSLSIGIIVDDAIMVLENIYRYRERGLDQVEAARQGANQITMAAVAASLALVAIFLPVAFMKGIIGKFFFQFAVTISMAVMLSLVEALTFTPMRAAQFLKVGERTTRFGRAVETGFSKLSLLYRLWLEKVLNYRWLVVGASLMIFVLSLGLFGVLRKEFVPAQDQSLFLCSFKTPVGSSLEFTDGRMRLVEAFAKTRPEVKRCFTMIGGFTGGEANTGFLFVTLNAPGKRGKDPILKRPLSQQEIMGVFRKELNKIPDLEAFIQDLSTMGLTSHGGFPVEFSVQGRDWEKLSECSQTIMARMRKNPIFSDVDTDYLLSVPEIRVIPNREKARARGIDMEDIGKTINSQVGGQRVGKYTRQGRRYDVRVRLIPQERVRAEDILNLEVWNNRGEIVRLKDVVDLKQVPSLVTVTRKNRERAISIYANYATGKSQQVALDEVRKIAKEVLPKGYRVVFSGSAQMMGESFSGLGFAFILGIFVAYMILASQFNRYIHPVIVLLAMPFSITGALIALFITNQSLNIYSLIGLILLMGIVKKNSILLVEFTNYVRQEKKADVRQALLEACPIRLRPILMTSVANITAAIPPAMALGPGAETRIPMAIAVLGGVTLSTILTLFVVPCAYSLLVKLERK